MVANTLDPSEITYENSETLTEFGLSRIAELTSFLSGMGAKRDAVIVSPTKRTQRSS
ncbi:MAG TPA: hypothetical protein VFQ61_19130 [Polyangiaceae bacterium]|nr:hypothetical protein [Polyangiaceae bacterium]